MADTTEPEMEPLRPAEHKSGIALAITPPNDYVILKQDARKTRRRALMTQIGMSIIANIAALSSGMGLGYPSITIEALKKCEDNCCLSDDQISWFASINTIACPFGGLLSALLLDLVGRKYTLMTTNILAIVSWAIVAFASQSNVDLMYIQLLVGRILIGVTTGLASSPAAVYSAEISYPEIRGRMSVLTSLSISIGILIAYLLGYLIPNDWRLVSGICCGISVGALLILIPLPESPIWLLSKKRKEQAEKNLKFFRGAKTYSEISQEMKNLQDQISSSQNQSERPQSFRDRYIQPQVYKPFILMLTFFVFQQFSGLFVLVVYATPLAISAGVSIDAFLFTVIIGSIRVVATGLGAYCLDKIGRKKPSIVSGAGMAFSMFGLVIFNQLFPSGSGLAAAILLLLYILMATVGFHVAPFAMVAEIYPRNVRGIMCGLTVSGAYLFSFISLKLYAFANEFISDSIVFAFFGVVAIGGCCFVGFFLPETKGKRLEEIEDYFKR